MNTKKCCSCEIVKNVSEFAQQKRKSDGLQAQCKDCRKAYNKSHYQRNKESYNKRRLNNQRKYRNDFKEFKKSLLCKICGETETVCLDFHHLDPAQKDFNVSTYSGNASVDNLKKELDKCIVLCSNCHRKVHAGIIEI